MVYIGNKHYYIFEPTRLISGEVVVPIFFYKAKGVLFAKCCTPQYQTVDGHEGFKMVIPANIKFTDPALQSIDIREFDEMYSELHMENHLSLAEACGGKLFGQSLDYVFLCPTYPKCID
jgi:hypothetical protein